MKIYEVRGNANITVAMKVMARNEEEAKRFAEDSGLSIGTEWNGNSVFIDYHDEYGCLEADCEIIWKEASEDFYYVGSRQEAYESDEKLSDWEEIECKEVKNEDGNMTEYTLYKNNTDNDDPRYVCVFGDRDWYSPEEEDWDWDGDSEDEAWEWFENYKGFEEEEE